MATNIISMPFNKKLGGTNYDIWSLKVPFFLNNGDIVEFLIASIFAPAERDEHGIDVTTSD